MKAFGAEHTFEKQVAKQTQTSEETKAREIAVANILSAGDSDCSRAAGLWRPFKYVQE